MKPFNPVKLALFIALLLPPILLFAPSRIGRAQIEASPARGDGAARVWRMTGPFGGDVDALAVDPRNSARLLLGSQDGQLFRSTDSGNSWQRVKPGIKAPDYTFTVILFDRERTGTIFVGAKQINDARDDISGGGVYRSDDDGQ